MNKMHIFNKKESPLLFLNSIHKSFDNFHPKDMIRFFSILVFIILFIASNKVWAQNGSNGTNVGTTSAAFLEIGAGARAQAMGGAYTALVQDA